MVAFFVALLPRPQLLPGDPGFGVLEKIVVFPSWSSDHLRDFSRITGDFDVFRRAGDLHRVKEESNMENCPTKLNTTGQLHLDYLSDRKSRFCQIDSQPIASSEVICPQPRRATRVPFLTDSLTKVMGKPKSSMPMYRIDCSTEILDLILGKDDSEVDPGYCCGSPPARTSNPVIHDAEFTKQTQSPCSLMASSPGLKSTGRVGSPTCGSSFGGSPKVRVEGFSCGKSESGCVIPALLA